MEYYTSGAPRVHRSGSEAQIMATIIEYEQAALANDELATDLLECAADLREELRIRMRDERWHPNWGIRAEQMRFLPSGLTGNRYEIHDLRPMASPVWVASVPRRMGLDAAWDLAIELSLKAGGAA